VRKVFAVLATTLVTVLVAQFFLAASGAFDPAPREEAFQAHRALGYATVLVALVLTIVAASTRTPGRLVGLTALVAGLGVVQGLIRAVAAAFDDRAGALVFGLHAVNALVMFGLALTVARRAWALTRPTGVADPAPAHRVS
jgi:FtsH-binding integral membrane protein